MLWIVEYRLPSGARAYRAFDDEPAAYEFASEIKALHGLAHVGVWDLFAREKEPSQ